MHFSLPQKVVADTFVITIKKEKLVEETEEKEKKEYEERLQRRLKILLHRFEEGKIRIAKDLKVIDSLKAVRYAPDGSVDLDTVDGLVRSLALVAEFIHDREELKKAISLSEIQNMYFTFLENNFGNFYKIMLERGLTPHHAGLALSRQTSTINGLVEQLPGFMETIEEFWKQTADAAHAHVEDMHDTLKGVFGGDLFPSHNENIASKCSIYTDTIILPDPFMRSKDLFKLWDAKSQVYYLIKHALNLLQYKELACADIVPPIVVILPDMAALEDSEKKFFLRLGQDDAVIHAGKVFGRKFESFEEVMEFASALDTLERVTSEIVDKNRVLFDTEWKGDLKAQIATAMDDDHAKLLGTKNPGVIVAAQALGRMCICNELLIKAGRLRGTPVIDAPTSWQYFAWKLEYDAENLEKENNITDMHILRGLQSLAKDEMQWLGRVPPDALIELRKIKALDEIRAILGKGVDKLTKVNPANFHRTRDQVFDNINEAFKKHKKNIKQLNSKKWKFAGKDIGSWLVVGTIEVAAAATGLPVWGLASIAADQLLDIPKLKDIPSSIKALAKESKELNQSPVGMLFKYKDKKV